MKIKVVVIQYFQIERNTFLVECSNQMNADQQAREVRGAAMRRRARKQMQKETCRRKGLRLPRVRQKPF
jgi:hypothetical protein